MKLFPHTLLSRTSLYLGVILVFSVVVWSAVIVYFLIRPLGDVYNRQISDTVRMAQAWLARDPADGQKLIKEFTGLRIVTEGGALPPFRDSKNIDLPPEMLAGLQAHLGEDKVVAQEQFSKTIWIRFRAGSHFYWFVVPFSPPSGFPSPILIWVGGAFALSIGGAYLIIFQLTRRLRHVTETARDFGLGRATPVLEETGAQEIKDLSAAFNQMRNDLGRHEGDRRLMLAGISHDLRTPLTRLRLAAELLPAGTDPGLASGMIQDIEELESILKQFLDYTRDGSEEPFITGDLNEITNEVCQRYIQSGHRIATDFENLPNIALRPLAWRRVVTNLIENAVRYGRESIEVKTRQEGETIGVEVSDCGPGVPPERLKDIARPFVRGTDARSDLGAGLGLAIVDRIVRAQGGQINLRNRPAGGFVARVELPIRSLQPGAVT